MSEWTQKKLTGELISNGFLKMMSRRDFSNGKGRERVFQTGKVWQVQLQADGQRNCSQNFIFERRTINGKAGTYLSLQSNEES